MSQLFQAKITGRGEIRPGVYLLEMAAPALARLAQPGQFLHIRCGEGNDPLLRRPISIHAVNRQEGLVKILFQVVGKGTRLLANRHHGWLDIMGPLGRGFTLPGEQATSPAKGLSGNLLVAGGGMGMAPLYFLLQELKDRVDLHRVEVLLGAAGADLLLVGHEVEKMGFNVQVATDDGSAGHRGTVVDLLAARLQRPGERTGFVYACGPRPMLKAVCSQLTTAGVAGEVSVEERMACGVGACLSCACQVRDAGGLKTYRRACLDGPVFPAGEVVFDD